MLQDSSKYGILGNQHLNLLEFSYCKFFISAFSARFNDSIQNVVVSRLHDICTTSSFVFCISNTAVYATLEDLSETSLVEGKGFDILKVHDLIFQNEILCLA